MKKSRKSKKKRTQPYAKGLYGQQITVGYNGDKYVLLVCVCLISIGLLVVVTHLLLRGEYAALWFLLIQAPVVFMTVYCFRFRVRFSFSKKELEVRKLFGKPKHIPLEDVFNIPKSLNTQPCKCQ